MTIDLEAIHRQLGRYQRADYSELRGAEAEVLADAVPALIAKIERLRDQLDARRELEDDVWDILKARLGGDKVFIDNMTVAEFRVFDHWIHLEAELLPQDTAAQIAAESDDDDGR